MSDFSHFLQLPLLAALPPLPPGLAFALQPMSFDPLQVRLGMPTIVVSR